MDTQTQSAIFLILFFGGITLYSIFGEDFVKNKNDKESKSRKFARGLVWLTNPPHLAAVVITVFVIYFLMDTYWTYYLSLMPTPVIIICLFLFVIMFLNAFF